MESLRSTGTLLTVVELAAALRVSRSFVYHHHAAGKLPAVRVGSRVRFDLEAVLQALKSGKGNKGNKGGNNSGKAA
jgi:excisionase family DNA binding protein